MLPVLPPEPDLLRRAQDGDEMAYRALLAWVALRVGMTNPVLAEESATRRLEEVLRQVHALRHTFDPARPFAPWVDAIIASVDRRRAWKRALGGWLGRRRVRMA